MRLTAEGVQRGTLWLRVDCSREVHDRPLEVGIQVMASAEFPVIARLTFNGRAVVDPISRRCRSGTGHKAPREFATAGCNAIGRRVSRCRSGITVVPIDQLLSETVW